MTKKISKKFLTENLEKMYWDARIELNYETPFQLLVAVMWSAQTTDIQVNKATAKFFDKMREPEDLIKMWESELKKNIWTLGFFNTKAKNAIKTAIILRDNFNSKIPSDIETLVELPWVWIKTAKVVLSELYNQPYLAVDTHVHRVLNRLRFVDTKLPEQTDKKLDSIFSDNDKRKMHHQLILFWRYFCLAKNPKCEEECPFSSGCKYYNEKQKKGW